jgi:hypothetical protein
MFCGFGAGIRLRRLHCVEADNCPDAAEWGGFAPNGQTDFKTTRLAKFSALIFGMY